MTTGTETDIYRAVQAAIWSGVTVDEFRKTAAYYWQVVLDEEKERASRNWK